MTDNIAPSPDAIWSMTPEQAGAEFSRMVEASRGPAPLPTTEPPKNAAEARSRLDLLAADASFRNKLTAGDADSIKTFDTLTTLIAQDADPISLALAGIIPAGMETLSAERPTTIRFMAAGAAALREQGLSEDCVREALVGSKNSPEIYRAAQNRQRERFADKDWAAKLLAGDFAANREAVLLSIVLSGEVA
jgi:hypothetical protein